LNKPLQVKPPVDVGQDEAADQKKSDEGTVVEKPTAGVEKPAARVMQITDRKGNRSELTGIHLGSGLWEYAGLRLKKPDPPPPAKPQSMQSRIKTMKRDLDQRIREKKKKEPIVPRVTVNGDTVVKWSDIKEVDIIKSRDDFSSALTYTARIMTTQNKIIEGKLKNPSDYVMGTNREDREVTFRLRDIEKIVFDPESGDEAKLSKPAETNVYKPKTKSTKPEGYTSGAKIQKVKPKQVQ
jgi:hypothetical protein